MAVACLPRFASAAEGAPPDRSWLSVAGIFGRAEVAEVPREAAGALLVLGHGFGPLHLQVEYTGLALTSDPGARGFSHRLGGALRVPWWQIGDDRPCYMDLGMELGGGYTWLRMEDGVEAKRADVQIGVSSAMVINAGGSRTRDTGLTFGVKVQLAGLGDDDVDTTLLGFVGMTFGR